MNPRLLAAAAILPLALATGPLAPGAPAPRAAVPVELEPLQQRHVAASATSVAHLDLHRAMQTTLGAELLASIEQRLRQEARRLLADARLATSPLVGPWRGQR